MSVYTVNVVGYLIAITFITSVIYGSARVVVVEEYKRIKGEEFAKAIKAIGRLIVSLSIVSLACMLLFLLIGFAVIGTVWMMNYNG